MADNIRIFTAISIPTYITGQIVSHLPEWMTHLKFQRWVDPRDLHITLHFIGDTSFSTVPDIKQAMTEAVSKATVFPLELSNLDIFGRTDQPSVLWLGLKKIPESLLNLHHELGQSLHSTIGFTPETRPYRPHVTLARKYTVNETGIPEKLQNLSSPFLQHQTAFDVNCITLYRTRMGERPMYEPLVELELNK